MKPTRSAISSLQAFVDANAIESDGWITILHHETGDYVQFDECDGLSDAEGHRSIIMERREACVIAARILIACSKIGGPATLVEVSDGDD